jgi:hypothetical protein
VASRLACGQPSRAALGRRKKSAPGSILSCQLIREAQTCCCLSRPARLPTWQMYRNMPTAGSAMSVVMKIVAGAVAGVCTQTPARPEGNSSQLF